MDMALRRPALPCISYYLRYLAVKSATFLGCVGEEEKDVTETTSAGDNYAKQPKHQGLLLLLLGFPASPPQTDRVRKRWSGSTK